MPQSVRRMIEERAEAAGFGALRVAATAMSDAYRDGRRDPLSPLPAALRTAAYLVTRMPATYAASYKALQEVRSRLSAAPVASVLDIGAGTGAASLAARQYFPQASITMIERDAALSEIARRVIPDAALIADDLTRVQTFPPHDVVIAAYSLGELHEDVARKLWQAARVAFVAIEPGTPRGYSLILGIRSRLLAEGAHMLAPCPGETPCPMAAPDWCHFAARVERSSVHRRVKGGALGYEDEKFSYVALTREPVELAPSRLIRHPRQRPGLIELETCTPQGLRPARVTRRDREAFRAARHAAWGDEWAGAVTL